MLCVNIIRLKLSFNWIRIRLKLKAYIMFTNACYVIIPSILKDIRYSIVFLDFERSEQSFGFTMLFVFFLFFLCKRELFSEPNQKSRATRQKIGGRTLIIFWRSAVSKIPYRFLMNSKKLLKNRYKKKKKKHRHFQNSI